MTPVREAIRRLTAEGALLPQGNRRVAVPQMDGSALEQVAFARLTLEPKLAELALRNLTPALIDRLDQIDTEVDYAIRSEDLPGYLRSNHAFHFALYEAADAPILLDMARSLWLRFGPSLRVVIQRQGATNLPDRHEEALAAMRTGDRMALALAIQNDIQQGIDQIRLAQAQGAV
jgi:DNA-binding GntR family transcriptional regulator